MPYETMPCVLLLVAAAPAFAGWVLIAFSSERGTAAGVRPVRLLGTVCILAAYAVCRWGWGAEVGFVSWVAILSLTAVALIFLKACWPDGGRRSR